MRLAPEQIRLITQTVSRWAGDGANVYLFGSRLNDKAKGGDVDLLVESDAPLSLIQRAQIKMALETLLGPARRYRIASPQHDSYPISDHRPSWLSPIGDVKWTKPFLMQRVHLASRATASGYPTSLLEAIQRYVYFLDASGRKLTWPRQSRRTSQRISREVRRRLFFRISFSHLSRIFSVRCRVNSTSSGVTF